MNSNLEIKKTNAVNIFLNSFDKFDNDQDSLYLRMNKLRNIQQDNNNLEKNQINNNNDNNKKN